MKAQKVFQALSGYVQQLSGLVCPITGHKGPEAEYYCNHSFFNLSAKWGWVVKATPRRFIPRKDPVPIVQEAGWAAAPVWTDAENLAPTGIRSPDRPVRSESLYRLICPAHLLGPTQSPVQWVPGLSRG